MWTSWSSPFTTSSSANLPLLHWEHGMFMANSTLCSRLMFYMPTGSSSVIMLRSYSKPPHSLDNASHSLGTVTNEEYYHSNQCCINFTHTAAILRNPKVPKLPGLWLQQTWSDDPTKIQEDHTCAFDDEALPCCSQLWIHTQKGYNGEYMTWSIPKLHSLRSIVTP